MRGCFIFLILFIPHAIFGLQSPPAQRGKLDKVEELSVEYERLRLEGIGSVMPYLDSMYQYFVEAQHSKGQAEVLTRIGETFLQTAQFPPAYDAYNEALQIYLSMDDELDIAKAYSGIGTVEGRRGNMTLANEWLLRALAIYDKHDHVRGLSSTYLKLGVVNVNLLNFDEAIGFYNQALPYALRSDSNDVVTLYNNIGAVYFHQDDLDQAIPYFEKALDFGSDPELESSQLLALSNLGAVYNMKGESKRASDFYLRGIEIAQKHQLREEELMIRHNLLGVYERADLTRAIRDAEEIWRVADSLDLYYVALGAANKLIGYNKRRADDPSVIKWMEEHRRISEIRYDENKTREISNLQSVHELNKSRANVVELQEKIKLREKADLYMWLAILALGIGLLIAFVMNHRIRKINTVLKIREKELHEKDKVKDYLFSIIAHDLRGALSAQIMALGILNEQRDTLPLEAQKLTKAMDNNIDEVSFVLDTLLHWGKKQIKGVYLEQSQFSTKSIIQEICSQLEVQIDLKELLVQDLTRDQTIIYADQNHFRFVLRNLMSNAVKYSKPGGVITIGESDPKKATEVIFYVRDQGVGIREEDKPFIFQTFNKSQIGTKKELGNGLALMISKEFVLLNGGDIWFEDNEGPGTTFYFKWSSSSQPKEL